MKPILLVEDESIMRESLKDWLSDSGYQVETAKDGDEAMKTVIQKDFTVAILDLKLPGKSGIEVLREVKQKLPQLKAIIITAFPTIETVVEAMKVGASDYLVKPFDLNELEKVLRNMLGPVQAEIRPKAVLEVVPAKPSVEKKPKAEELVVVTPTDVPAHLKKGREYFNSARYPEALKEFDAILDVAPGDIETRILIAKTKKVLETPGPAGLSVAAKPKYCVWMSRGLVNYRLCTFDYDCIGCEYEKSVQARLANGDPEVEAVVQRELDLPGNQRVCRYAQKQDVSYRLCPRLFRCQNCDYAQMKEYVTEQKLVAREEAMDKRKQEWWWSYWS